MILFIGWAFIVMGVGAFLLLTNSLIKAAASSHWPSVLGQLQSSEIKRVTVTTRRGANRSSIGGDRTNFLYSYEVGGQSYSSKRVTFSDYVVKTKNALDALVRKSEKQDLINVYYNPENPKESVLIPGISIYNILPFISFSLFICVGVVTVFFNEEALKIIQSI